MTSTDAPIERDTKKSFGIDRRTVLRTSVWAVPVVALAVASPAAAASPIPGQSTIRLRNPAFQPNGGNYYRMFIQLEVEGSASDVPVTGASVSVVVTSTSAPFTFDTAEVSAGAGWSEPTLNTSTNTYSLSWAGPAMQAGGGSYFSEPIGIQIHATSIAMPTSFTATISSAYANSAAPQTQPVG